jgi:hypothetical protein
MAVYEDGDRRGAMRRAVVQAVNSSNLEVRRAKTSQSRLWDRKRTEGLWRCGDCVKASAVWKTRQDKMLSSDRQVFRFGTQPTLTPLGARLNYYLDASAGG